MAFGPKVSSLSGANLFWNVYGITIEEHGRTGYKATFGDGRFITVDTTLTELWYALGDFLIANQATGDRPDPHTRVHNPNATTAENF